MESNSSWLIFIDQITSIIEKIVGIALMVFATSEFRKYRQKKCSEAAAKFLGLFKGTVEDVITIVDRPEIFQHPHINNDLTISSEIKKGEVDPYKPSNMIANKIISLEKEFHLLCAQISGKKAIELRKLVAELKKNCSSLQSAVRSKLEKNVDHLNAPNNKKVLSEYHQRLQSIMQDAEKILFPIIEGNMNNYWYYLKMQFKESIFALPIPLVCLFIYWWNRDPNNSASIPALILIVIAGIFTAAFLRYITSNKY